MARFMTGGRYQNWQSQEQFPHRIDIVNPRDPDRPAQGADNREDLLMDLLAKRRRQLKTFLGQVAKCTSRNMYATIVRHATSLDWIYNKIRQDYDIQQKGIHFLNIIDLKYDAQTKTPASFYNEYRTVILNNVGRQNERIHYRNQDLPADEQVGPLFEDLILLNVLTLIDPRLPAYVKEHYRLKLGERRLMDIKTDIFTNTKKFLSDLDAADQLNSIRLNHMAVPPNQPSPSLSAFTTSRSTRGQGRGLSRGRPISSSSRRTFCKTCYDNDQGKSVYLSHTTDHSSCPTTSRLNAIVDEHIPAEVLEQEIEDYGDQENVSEV